jgi:hypothetical protein
VKWKKQHRNLKKKSLPIIGKSLSDKLADPVQSNKAMRCNMFSLRLSVRLLPRKSQGSERWARRAISPGYFLRRKAVTRQAESQYAGWLLLDTYSRRPTGEIPQKVIHCYFLDNVYTPGNTECSAICATGCTYFRSCDKKLKLFCYPVFFHVYEKDKVKHAWRCVQYACASKRVLKKNEIMKNRESHPSNK